ncbi:isoprenylcysteine carboxylmethyltransferase family protein [Kitasatospora sp. GP82]|uniref:methyltransferase family protein n=1 Tax=Kitasatospora sp. GP82 TaxID=3035089 RepID=UPI0024754E38|nr:isoprenylcysteine carboxylmethyltransferase family protein [Kitasatospora sp. GP82]MDH6123380.1 protein-S-isoprenylcysteine O-methyltransferase Ste14 [Kitasatospora sp. GP82]
MVDWVRSAFTVTLWVWLAAEVLLQARQLRHSGRTKSTEWRSLLVFVVLGAGVAVLAGPLGRAVPALSYPVGGVLAAVMLVLTWAGIGLRLWSIRTLGRYFRGTVHIQEGHRVVDWGPYRLVRHPAYTGALLAGTAAAATFGNAASWLLVTGGLGLAVGYRIRVEERVLSLALGEAYTSYAARTHRLVPGIW